MNSIHHVFSDLFAHPEKTFPIFGTKGKAYLYLYIFPSLILFLFSISTAYYGSIIVAILLSLAFLILYLGVVFSSYQSFRSPRRLRIASEVVLPEVLISYFKKQYPSASVPMMLDKDRKRWIAYGHIDKRRMARAMTFVEYHLMDPPPRLTSYFIDRSHKITHQYLIIEDPVHEVFRITDSPSDDNICYPVTVFEKD